MVGKLFFLLVAAAVLMTNAHVSASAADENHIVWSRGTDLPLARGGYFAAWHGGSLWLAGGTYWKDGKKLWTDETSFYDPKKKSWTRLAPLPRALAYGVTSTVGKDLYILGGADAEGDLNKDVFRLRDGKWSKIGEAPAGFVYASTAAIGSKIYILAGATSLTDVTKSTNNAWVFDVETERWEKLPNVPGDARQIHASAAVGTSIYLFGGVSQKPGEKHYNLGDAYRYETTSGKWSALKNLPQPMRAFWASAVGGSVYLFGGFGEAGLDTVYRYSPADDDFELVSRLPQPLMDTKFIYAGGNFYGAGGEDKLVSRFSGLVIGRLTR